MLIRADVGGDVDVGGATDLVVLHLQLLVLGLVAAADLLDLSDGLVLLQDIVVLALRVLLQAVPLRAQPGHIVLEPQQLGLGRVTAGVGPAPQIRLTTTPH